MESVYLKYLVTFMCVCVCHSAWVWRGGAVRNSVLSVHPKNLWTKLRLLGLAAGTFTCWAVSLTPKMLIFNTVLMCYKSERETETTSNNTFKVLFFFPFPRLKNKHPTANCFFPDQLHWSEIHAVQCKLCLVIRLDLPCASTKTEAILSTDTMVFHGIP